MGIRLEVFKVADDKLHDVLWKIKEYYLNEHKTVKHLISENDLKKLDDVDENFYKAELQLFRVNDQWMFRPREQSYFFMNNFKEMKLEVEHVWYIGSVGEGNISYDEADVLAEEIDKKIRTNDYFLYPLINKYMLINILYKIY